MGGGGAGVFELLLLSAQTASIEVPPATTAAALPDLKNPRRSSRRLAIASTTSFSFSRSSVIRTAPLCVSEGEAAKTALVLGESAFLPGRTCNLDCSLT